MRSSIASRWGLLGSLSLLTLALGCGDDGSGDGSEALGPALESAVDNSIIPAMQAFADSATSLEQDTLGFCLSPSESALVAAQDRWLELTRVWNEAAVYFMDTPNPLNDDIITPSVFFIESMRPRGVDYTSTVQETIDATLQSSDTLDEDFFSQLTFNRVGILALEVLLFEDFPRTAGSTDVSDVVEGYRSSPRKCVYLEGMVQLLAGRARGVAAGWTEEFNESGVPFRDLLLSGQLEDGAEPVPAVIVSAVGYLEYIRRRKLQVSLDARIASRARPGTDPFFANATAGLEEVQALLEQGTADGDGGFFDIMAERGFEESVELVRTNIALAFAALEARDPITAADAFRTVENNLRQEVPIALAVELGIAFTDGD